MNPIFLIRHIHNLFVYCISLSLDVKNMSNMERTTQIIKEYSANVRSSKLKA